VRLSRLATAFCTRVLLAAVLGGALVTTGVVAANRYIGDQLERIPRVDVHVATRDGAGANLLLIGSDSRSFVADPEQQQAFGDEGDTGPARSDTIIVLHADGPRSFAVSFPRDLWVDIPGRGGAKINAAFNDGPQRIVDTLRSNYHLPIHHYLEVDFATFQGIVDALGSVPVYVPSPSRDLVTGFFAPVPGCVALAGDQALAYVRLRAMEV
jgi:LCP family protein required for cell wall assembly